MCPTFLVSGVSVPFSGFADPFFVGMLICWCWVQKSVPACLLLACLSACLRVRVGGGGEREREMRMERDERDRYREEEGGEREDGRAEFVETYPKQHHPTTTTLASAIAAGYLR